MTDQYAYDAFGENTAHTGSAAQPFGFMGNQSDLSTGLANFNAREYDPVLGRFLSQDPVAGNPAAPQTFDPYSYGAGNPLANPDTSGMATAEQFLDPFSGVSSEPFYLSLGVSHVGKDGHAIAVLFGYNPSNGDLAVFIPTVPAAEPKATCTSTQFILSAGRCNYHDSTLGPVLSTVESFAEGCVSGGPLGAFYGSALPVIGTGYGALAGCVFGGSVSTATGDNALGDAGQEPVEGRSNDS